MSVESAKKPTVLVVDDKPLNIQVLAEALKEDYRVKIATSGEKALEIVAQDEQPDLIILDVMMPEMDGYEVCKRLKSDDSTRDIPVIFVTAKDDAADEEHGLELGAIDYISKPFNIAIVKARVKTHLSLKLKTDLLNMLTSVDGLTGVANRRSFDAKADKEYRRCLRSGVPISMLMIDVDFFKQYNDTYGHCAGDNCLKKIASILSSELKRPGDVVARYGGEEFAVLLPGLNTDEAVFMAEKLRKSVVDQELEHSSSDACKHVTISVGVATIQAADNPSNSVQQLIHMADKNLYAAKSEGRNRVICSDNGH